MMATKVAVAFHTMDQTTAMSASCTTPSPSATAAPSDALQPMPSPRGCQMTSTRVATKISTAISIAYQPLQPTAAGAQGRPWQQFSLRYASKPFITGNAAR
ncbi:hypothetical protein D3C71_1749810 [compost metagenome]